jgi:hypothetical protein
MCVRAQSALRRVPVASAAALGRPVRRTRLLPPVPSVHHLRQQKDVQGAMVGSSRRRHDTGWRPAASRTAEGACTTRPPWPGAALRLATARCARRGRPWPASPRSCRKTREACAGGCAAGDACAHAGAVKASRVGWRAGGGARCLALRALAGRIRAAVAALARRAARAACALTRRCAMCRCALLGSSSR